MALDTNPPSARLLEAEGIVKRSGSHQVPRGASLHARAGKRLSAVLSNA